MAATETRLLVLGAVSLFEPVNGYQIRRELISWGVEQWAHIKPGSIYSSLNTLAGHGHLARHDVVDGGRDVAVYTTTDEGRAEMRRLFAVAIETFDPLAPLAFHTAISLLPLVPRADFVRHLTVRIERLHEAGLEAKQDLVDVPPHVSMLAALWRQMGVGETQWCERMLAAVNAGELTFAGETSTWKPPSDDPGWQMAEDRERYRRLLGS